MALMAWWAMESEEIPYVLVSVVHGPLAALECSCMAP